MEWLQAGMFVELVFVLVVLTILDQRLAVIAKQLEGIKDLAQEFKEQNEAGV